MGAEASVTPRAGFSNLFGPEGYPNKILSFKCSMQRVPSGRLDIALSPLARNMPLGSFDVI